MKSVHSKCLRNVSPKAVVLCIDICSHRSTVRHALFLHSECICSSDELFCRLLIYHQSQQPRFHTGITCSLHFSARPPKKLKPDPAPCRVFSACHTSISLQYRLVAVFWVPHLSKRCPRISSHISQRNLESATVC